MDDIVTRIQQGVQLRPVADRPKSSDRESPSGHDPMTSILSSIQRGVQLKPVAGCARTPPRRTGEPDMSSILQETLTNLRRFTSDSISDPDSEKEFDFDDWPT